MASKIILVRHGETEWSRDRKHTSVTDLPLTAVGTAACEPLREYFAAVEIDHIYSSPMQRARVTAQLVLQERDHLTRVTDALMEWNYGEYEGITTAEIKQTHPNWDLWADGCPGGESPKDVESRLAPFIEEWDRAEGTVMCFAHGHILRALTSMWVFSDISLGDNLHLDTATVSKLGYEHSSRAIHLWNSSVQGAK